MLLNTIMKKTRISWCIRLAITALPVLSILNLPVARADSEPDKIVAMDLLTVKKPSSEAESRLRVIRLTTQSGAMGFGDYLHFGLTAKDEEETLARLVNRYGEQRYKQDIFMTDPSMPPFAAFPRKCRGGVCRLLPGLW